jgi:hypothetical protein
MVPKTDLMYSMTHPGNGTGPTQASNPSMHTVQCDRPSRPPNPGADWRLLPGCARRFIRADPKSEPLSGGKLRNGPAHLFHEPSTRWPTSSPLKLLPGVPSKILTRIGSITVRRSAGHPSTESTGKLQFFKPHPHGTWNE